MRVRFVVVLLVALFVVGGLGLLAASSAVAPNSAVVAPRTVNVPALAATIGRLRGPQLSQLLDKNVTIEGVFYDGSIPMIVDRLDLVRSNLPLKPENYVPLVGPVPTTLRWGDRVSVTGKLSRPSAADPASVRQEVSVLRLQASEPPRVLVRTALVAAALRPVVIGTVRPLKNKYGVLISGGYNAANNHVRYWNDLKAAYNLLLSKGYPAANIYVIYANGVARDASMPVNASATKANIATVFNTLAGRMGAYDDLYIFTTDHGGLVGGSSVLWLWNAVSMSAAEFAAEVNKIHSYSKMMVAMEQCYSGGFVGPLTGTKRVIMSACSPSQVSWAAASLQFDEFVFWHLAALSGSKPDGTGAVNADANADGKVCLVESYNFAQSHDAASETPQYEDNGAAPCHTGQMPSGGDGPYGATCNL